MGVAISITPDTDEMAACYQCGEETGNKDIGTPVLCLKCKSNNRSIEGV